LAVGGLGRGPAFPAVGSVEDEAVGLAFQFGLGRLVLLQRVEVFQEQQPGRLLGVVQLAGAAGVLVQDVVDVLEGCSNMAVEKRLNQHYERAEFIHGTKHRLNVWAGPFLLELRF
jgi:hypothetical protein